MDITHHKVLKICAAVIVALIILNIYQGGIALWYKMPKYICRIYTAFTIYPTNYDFCLSYEFLSSRLFHCFST